MEPEVDSEPVVDAELISEAPEDTGADADEQLAAAEEAFVAPPTESTDGHWRCPVARCKTQYPSYDTINISNHLQRQHGIKKER